MDSYWNIGQGFCIQLWAQTIFWDNALLKWKNPSVVRTHDVEKWSPTIRLRNGTGPWPWAVWNPAVKSETAEGSASDWSHAAPISHTYITKLAHSFDSTVYAHPRQSFPFAVYDALFTTVSVYCPRCWKLSNQHYEVNVEPTKLPF